MRHVPEDGVAELRKDIEGYQRFAKLAERCADEVIH
jgi:hypothetical protein